MAKRVEISTTTDGTKLLAFKYNDARGWWLQADGAGHSLVPTNIATQPEDSLNYGRNWRPSAFIGGSPGSADPSPTVNVILNEVAPHTDTGNPAPADSNDWFELLNLTAGSVSLSDWYVSDDVNNLTKYELGNGFANIGANGRLIFDEATHFNTTPGIPDSGFGLTKRGEQLLLSYLPAGNPTLHRVADVARFKGVENEDTPAFSTWGRSPDGGNWWYNTTTSKNSANSAPKVEVVISEFMYHPTSDLAVDEYIELHNPTGAAILLQHATEGPWRIDTSGLSWVLPAGITMAADERILLVPFDPGVPAQLTAFEAVYGSVPGQIFGPWTFGMLSNQGEKIALERPQPEDVIGEGISWVIVDEAIYFDQAPWTPDADGTGNSLNRIDANVTGNDWGNWGSAVPSVNVPPSSLDVLLNSGEVVNSGTTDLPSISFSATFTEAVNGFEQSSIIVTNGSPINFSGGDGDTVFTFKIQALSVGQVTVRIPAASAQAAGSGSSSNASITYSYTFTNEQAEPTDVDILWYLLGNDTFDEVKLNKADNNGDAHIDLSDIFLAPVEKTNSRDSNVFYYNDASTSKNALIASAFLINNFKGTSKNSQYS